MYQAGFHVVVGDVDDEYDCWGFRESVVATVVFGRDELVSTED